MRTRADPARAVSLALAAATATWLLTGCGAVTKTVTVSSAPSARAPSPQGTTSVQPPSHEYQHDLQPAPPAGSTSTGATSPTRTAPEPQFEQTEGKPTAETPAGLAGPLAVLRAHGYGPVDTSQYHPDQTLQVLVGRRETAAGATVEQAFFFVDGHYVGTDAAQPSGQLSLVSQGDTEATLAYGLYRPGDSACCPSGGQARVRFQLNDGQLGAIGAIPAASSPGGLSRR